MAQASLTADLAARAIIAAARVYGDDPERCLRASRGRVRRALGAAVQGLSTAAGVSLGQAARLLGYNASNLGVSRHHERFAEASAAAEAAARAEISRAPRGRVSAKPAPPRPDPGVTLPPPKVTVRKPPTLTAGAVRRQVAEALSHEPATAPELIDRLGLGEAQVREALTWLRDDGQLVADAITAEGWRLQLWRAAR